MAVIDHAVHPSTKIDSSHRYGCWNRKPFMDAYYAPNRAAGTNGYSPVWFYERVRIPHVMSRECRYDMSLTDNACDGCNHRGTGEAYAKHVKDNA